LRASTTTLKQQDAILFWLLDAFAITAALRQPALQRARSRTTTPTLLGHLSEEVQKNNKRRNRRDTGNAHQTSNLLLHIL